MADDGDDISSIMTAGVGDNKTGNSPSCFLMVSVLLFGPLVPKDNQLCFF